MYYDRDIPAIETELGTSAQGLSTEEAQKRQQKFGKNILPQKPKDSILKIFINEFKDPIVLLLLVAIIVSFVVGEIVDACVIIGIVFIDAFMGTYQENKANSTAESLSKLVAAKARVLRDGQKVLVDAESLTIGDIAFLESGDKISADMRIVSTQNFMVNESILTGESLPVEKIAKTIKHDHAAITDQSNMAFSGTTVVSGRAEAIVVNIGLDTELGKIADSINNAPDEKTPLTIRIEKFSKQISVLVVAIAIIVAILLILKHNPYDVILLTVIAFAVSALPEGLPLALTMALTIASNRMAKKNVIVRRLSCAESLGSCTVIASDKTGTLTVNQQTAKKIVLADGSSFDISGTGYETKGEIQGEGDIAAVKQLALLGVLNNEASIAGDHPTGDSIDIAFLVLGEKLDAHRQDIETVYQIPYESEKKYSAVFYRQGEETYCAVKGSLEVVESFCDHASTGKSTPELHAAQNVDLAKDGFRVIAVANGKVAPKSEYSEKDLSGLQFMGLVGFIDPIRKEAATSISECHLAGIKVLMVTGDHPLTAFSIAKDLKLAKTFDEIATGDAVDQAYREGEKHFDDFISQKLVFARVTPLQKLKIIESLKRQGEFVAVTGDGVNDAPALKSANIGVAMGSGTDIARETADMIIADDNFKSIVAGIKEGRVAYANIRKIIYFLVSCGLAEAVFFCLSITCDMEIPLLAVQLLWLNVVTDGIQDFALSFESAEKGILREKPRSPKESIFDRSLFTEIAVSGLAIGVIVFAVWNFLLGVLHMDVNIARGYILCLMVFIQNVHVFNCRSEAGSAFSIPLSSNKLISFGILGIISLQIFIMENDRLSVIIGATSIPPLQMFALFMVALSILVIMELYKRGLSLLHKRRYFNRWKTGECTRHSPLGKGTRGGILPEVKRVALACLGQ